MRLYGSSPLYSYVELIFRCKRLFIIAIVLGTLISSVLVATKAKSYTGSTLIQLVGQHPELVKEFEKSSVQSDKVLEPARRKAELLKYWINNVPTFLNEVVAKANIKAKYPDKSPDELADQVRKRIAEPSLKSQSAVEVQIAWNDKQEANDILNALYERFKEKTVSQENTSLTNLKQILEKQHAKAERDANDLAKRRIAYQSSHFNAIPTMLSAQVGRVEQSQSQLEDSRLDLADAQQRLRDISSQIESVPQEIVEQRREEGTIDNPAIGLSQEYDELDKQYKQLTAVYSAQHPKVIDLQKRMAALKQQIEEKKQEFNNKPQVAKSTTRAVTRISNPEYRELMQQKRELERTVSAQSRRVAALQSTLTRSRSSIQVMPNTEIEWQKLDSDYQLADQIRRNRKSQLELVKLDLERDEDISGRQLFQEVPPAAKPTETASKTVVFFALGPILAIVVAFCFSLLLETMDHTLRTPVEAEKYLNKPVLAVIPKMAVARDSRKQLGGSSKTGITS